MNQFEAFLQKKIQAVKLRQNNQNKTEKELIHLIIIELTYSELYIIQRDFKNVDVTQIIEKIIYIEARNNGFSPEDAIVEKDRQMELREKDEEN